jgi:hypothetical protein
MWLYLLIFPARLDAPGFKRRLGDIRQVAVFFK